MKILQKILIITKKPIVRIIFSVGILSALLIWLPIDDLITIFQDISVSSWLLVAGGYLFGHAIGAVKWGLLINMGKKKLPLHRTIQYYFAALFANLFLPSLAGGDVVKAGLVVHYNKEKGFAIFGTLLDRVIDTGAIVFIIFIAALFSPQFLQRQDQIIVYIILASLIGLFIAALLFLKIEPKFPKYEKFNVALLKLKQIVHHAIKNPIRPLIAFMLSFCIQVGFVFLTIYLARFCGIEIPFVLWFLIWPLAKLSALLPVGLGGIGVREVALAALLSRLLVPASNSVALGILWDSILIFGSLFGGFLYLTIKKLGVKDSLSVIDISNKINLKT